MLCALCLYEQHTRFSDRLIANDAITIANGQAVCATHFISVQGKVSNSGGTVALAMLRREGFNAS